MNNIVTVKETSNVDKEDEGNVVVPVHTNCNNKFCPHALNSLPCVIWSILCEITLLHYY